MLAPSVVFRCGTALLALLPPAPGLRAEPAKIYGVAGEAWQATGGPLPDFSFAGYQRGEQALPERQPEVSVKDHGAVGDGKADDTAAIQKAIDANPGKVIHLPEGRYRLTRSLTLVSGAHGTVLQGDGPARTVLTAEVPLQEIEPLPISYPETGGTAYAYSGAFIRFTGSTGYFENSGSAVAEPVARGATELTLAGDHGFKKGDEVVVLAHEASGQSLLRYLYRDDADDLSRAGDSLTLRQVSRITAVKGAQVTLERPLRTELRAEWKPELRRFQPRLQEVGVERLAFEFPDKPYEGHFTERGFNAIQFIGVAHGWVRDVVIRNADSGIFLNGSVFCSLSGIVIESSRRANNTHEATGHHGLSLTSLDCLCTDFEFRTKFIHDLTVSAGSVGCVFRNGSGPDLSLDHHKRAPYENLFSNLDLGKGSRVFLSGGHSGIGRHAGAGNTYWNLRSRSDVDLPAGFGPARQNFIGVKLRGRGKPDAEGLWLESIPPGKVEPADLYSAQLDRRLGKAAPLAKPVPSTPAAVAAQAWTNDEGRTLQAVFKGLEGEHVLLLLANGQTVRYPLAKLTPASREQAQRLAGE